MICTSACCHLKWLLGRVAHSLGYIVHLPLESYNLSATCSNTIAIIFWGLFFFFFNWCSFLLFFFCRKNKKWKANTVFDFAHTAFHHRMHDCYLMGVLGPLWNFFEYGVLVNWCRFLMAREQGDWSTVGSKSLKPCWKSAILFLEI